MISEAEEEEVIIGSGGEASDEWEEDDVSLCLSNEHQHTQEGTPIAFQATVGVEVIPPTSNSSLSQPATTGAATANDLSTLRPEHDSWVPDSNSRDDGGGVGCVAI